jgi:hypothetical protein
MEEFISITMTAREYELLLRAAKKKRKGLHEWALMTLLDAATKATKEKEPADPAITARTLRFVSEYHAALGYKPSADQEGRTWASAKRLAMSDAVPDDLASVMAWVRVVDGRYRLDQYLPLQMVEQHWPAYLAQRPVKAHESQRAAQNVPEATSTPLSLFGDDDTGWI